MIVIYNSRVIPHQVFNLSATMELYITILKSVYVGPQVGLTYESSIVNWDRWRAVFLTIFVISDSNWLKRINNLFSFNDDNNGHLLCPLDSETKQRTHYIKMYQKLAIIVSNLFRTTLPRLYWLIKMAFEECLIVGLRSR